MKKLHLYFRSDFSYYILDSISLSLSIFSIPFYQLIVCYSALEFIIRPKCSRKLNHMFYLV
jgi:hypothetical protein